MVDLTVNKSKK
jgi:hypothetical protein